MEIIISDQEKEKPELAHRREWDSRICDRIKTVLLCSENIIGGIELNDLSVLTTYQKTVNTESIIEFFTKLSTVYFTATALHIILDQAGCHCSEEARKFAQENTIALHYLPPYSPNLNPIERL